MKKIALLPAIALLLLGACSDNDDPRPVPTDKVISVQPVPDNQTLVAPEQIKEYQREVAYGSSAYRFKYTNGQEIIYDVLTDGTNYFAAVKKIEGTAENVILPPTITAVLNDVVTDIPVSALNLFVDATSDNIKSIGVSGATHYMVVTANNVNTLEPATADHIRVQVSKCPGVSKFIFDASYPDYTTMEGAIYTTDFSELVAVPMAYEGNFTVTDGTVKIQDRALFKCTEINSLTIPASVKSIGHEAVVNTTKLALVNMLSDEAPIAYDDSFGSYAFTGLLRIPENSIGNYTFAKPDLTEPTEPAFPSVDDPDEVWDAYYDALDKYDEELAEYNNAMSTYTNHAAYTHFTRIEQVKFEF